MLVRRRAALGAIALLLSPLLGCDTGRPTLQQQARIQTQVGGGTPPMLPYNPPSPSAGNLLALPPVSSGASGLTDRFLVKADYTGAWSPQFTLTIDDRPAPTASSQTLTDVTSFFHPGSNRVELQWHEPVSPTGQNGVGGTLSLIRRRGHHDETLLKKRVRLSTAYARDGTLTTIIPAQ